MPKNRYFDLYSFNDYQTRTRETAIYPDKENGTERALNYLALGLTSEAGEVADKLKKAMRDGVENEAAFFDALARELGDAMWYIARLADEMNYSLSDIVALNQIKLNKRKQEGKLNGSGDER